jgi:hypothetical protein
MQAGSSDTLERWYPCEMIRQNIQEIMQRRKHPCFFWELATVRVHTIDPFEKRSNQR